MEGLAMVFLGVLVLIGGAAAALFTGLYLRARAEVQSKGQALANAEAEIESLRPFREVRDATAAAFTILERANTEAREVLERAGSEAAAMRKSAEESATITHREAEVRARALAAAAEATVEQAARRANELVRAAEREAQETAGAALKAKENAQHYERTVVAMRNIIEGYGDRYVLPTYSLLDELADDFGFAEAGKKLKEARDLTKSLVASGRAATCDYVENSRRETAVRFVVDAFNGKVDSILTQVKATNHGTLAQQIRDAYNLVNHNGAAFRSARVLPEYLNSRLEELNWATRAMALRDREREEQRQIKERLRDEERARKEYERALREAQKEEETLKRAIEKAQLQVAKANEEQRDRFEAQLLDLNERLRAAEEKNQRAVSMAQLTRSGHVYVISNIGSFGDDVLKIGMTRRLEPLERIRELGDASVPFSFDVHAMIWAEDAPALERELHKRFVDAQLNKVNPRKEFFRVPVSAVRDLIEGMQLEAVWTMAAEAAEYRESLAIERSLTEDAAAREAWVRRQLEWDPAAEAPEELEAVAP